jgi:chromosome segregation ATPase
MTTDAHAAVRERLARQKMEMRQLRSALHRAEESARIANEEADSLQVRITELECECALIKASRKQVREELWRARHPWQVLWLEACERIGLAVAKVCPA